MTERLAQMLHDEADALDIPHAPALAVYRRGRTVRRRQQVVASMAVAALVVVGASGAMTFGNESGGQQEPQFTGALEGYAAEGAVAVGDQLFVDGEQVRIDGSVKSTSYSAAGVVVASGKPPWTDSRVDQYTLIRPDGSTDAVDIEPGVARIATEPDSDRLAYATRKGEDGNRWDIVVVSLTTGKELSRVTVDGVGTIEGWETPLVALDEDLMWARFVGGWTEVNWRSGEVRPVPGTSTFNVIAIANGIYTTENDGVWTTRSMADGAVLDRMPKPKGHPAAAFSPDGRHLRVWELVDGNRPTFLYDPRTGSRHNAPAGYRDFGWTPSGHLQTVDVDTGQVLTCGPLSGDCQPTDLRFEVPEKFVIYLGGNDYAFEN